MSEATQKTASPEKKGDRHLYSLRGYPLDASRPYILWFPSTSCRYGAEAVTTACCMRLYTARGQELRELVRWPSEAVDCQPVPTASEGHRTKPQIVTACGIEEHSS